MNADRPRVDDVPDSYERHRSTAIAYATKPEVCEACGGRIQAGERIALRAGSGPQHVACALQRPEASKCGR